MVHLPLADSERAASIVTMPSIILLLLFILVFMIVHYYNKKSPNKSDIRLPPGPWGLPFLSSLPFLQPNLHHNFTHLANTYCPIFSIRLGLKLFIVVSSPSLAKEVLKDQDPTMANRDVPATAQQLPNGSHGMAWSSNTEEHHALRKLTVREFFACSKQESFAGLRGKKVNKLLRQVEARVGTPASILDLMFGTFLDIMTHMLWDGSGFQAEVKQFMKGLNEVFTKTNMRDYFPAISMLKLSTGLDREAMKVCNRFKQVLDLVIASD